MSPFTALFAAAVVVSVVLTVHASDFLHSHHQASQLLKREVEDALLSELMDQTDSRKLQRIQDELRPMFKALPKNADGQLEPATVRYALHRYFVQSHGWYVSGLDPVGGAWNTSSPASIMKGRSPAYIQSLFEMHLQGKGLVLNDLSVFAATLTDLIHEEAASYMREIYHAFSLFVDSAPKKAEQLPEDAVLTAYLAKYLVGGDLNIRGTEELKILETEMPLVYPAWVETLMWAKDMYLSIEFSAMQRRNPFIQHAESFDEAVSFVQELGHRFGSFQNLECQRLKGKLVEMEHQGSGRVPLSRFYSGGLDGDWQFTESVDYLRNMGVLDETDTRRPSVVISNYIISQTNCLTSSSFYAVCCSAECEGLTRHLERAVEAPTASPSRIAEVVANLGSDTVEAPRNLSLALLQRLGDIATLHGGHVPLHGRLFSQWMHHAYPRECPFPHASGTTTPMSPDEWMAAYGIDGLEATREEMEKHNSSPHESETEVAEGTSDALPWTLVEELVAVDDHVRNARGRSWASSICRWTMAIVALCSMAQGLKHVSATMLPDKKVEQRCLV